MNKNFLDAYDCTWKNSNTMIVFSHDRQQTLKELIESGVGEYDPDPTKGSSIGFIKSNDGFKILVKPPRSYNADNENFLIEKMNEYAGQYRHVAFMTPSGKMKFYSDIVSFHKTSYNRGQRNKADFELMKVNGSKISFSLKKDDAHSWESVDTYAGKDAAARLAELIRHQADVLEYREQGNFYRLKNELCWTPTRKQVEDVVFGSDILASGGGVIIKTFSHDDFYILGRTLMIKVDCFIQKIEEIPESKRPMFLLRNDVSRNSQSIGFKGLRVLAVAKERVDNSKKSIDFMDLTQY